MKDSELWTSNGREKKRDLDPKGKSYWTLKLRESLTSTLVPRGENQWTTRIVTCYLHKYSVVSTAPGDSLSIVHVIHDLINKHNGRYRHHLLSRTTLKKKDISTYYFSLALNHHKYTYQSSVVYLLTINNVYTTKWVSKNTTQTIVKITQ